MCIYVHAGMRMFMFKAFLITRECSGTNSVLYVIADKNDILADVCNCFVKNQ